MQSVRRPTLEVSDGTTSCPACGWMAMGQPWEIAAAANALMNEKHENPTGGSDDFSCDSCFSYPQRKRPRLNDDALYGPVGEIIRRIAPVTGADPAAMLVQLLTGLGSLIGPGPHIMAGGARHCATLFTVICERTAKARKETSLARVRHNFSELDEPWLPTRVKSGVVSGEGVTQLFRETEDKRLLLIEGEVGQVLQEQESTLFTRWIWDNPAENG